MVNREVIAACLGEVGLKALPYKASPDILAVTGCKIIVGIRLDIEEGTLRSLTGKIKFELADPLCFEKVHEWFAMGAPE